MSESVKIKTPSKSEKTAFGLQAAILGVAFNGLTLIIGTLADDFIIRHRGTGLMHISSAIFSLPILAGLTLLYLSSLLARRKRTAWMLTIPVYSFIFGINAMQALLFEPERRFAVAGTLRNFVLPLVIVVALIYYRKEFTVKSDLDSFRQATFFSVLVLAIAFIYGVTGFMLMDEHDFGHEISFGEAVHRTVDQAGLTTTTALTAYTGRARVFTDSLSVVSIGAVGYALISLFQPLKSRFGGHQKDLEDIKHLLERYPATSEDFFKLWPKDKQYFFTPDRQAALALHVRRGVALVVGDPAGQPEQFASLVRSFDQFCYGNDWRAAFIHTEPKYNKLYLAQGFSVQKIGEEAVLGLSHFKAEVAGNKYFRHINNKFDKLGYTAELLAPPYSDELIDRLRQISADWASQPGRVERGLMMGYFFKDYLSQCNLVVVRDAGGTPQAFLNQIPSFDKTEANFDMFRHASHAPGNINDFLLMNFINYVLAQGYEKLNLGFTPLVGLDKKDETYSLVDNALRFAYANGDKLYSFSGLHRFKAKYEPQWSARYIVHRGGISGFTRTVNALNGAMKVKTKLL